MEKDIKDILKISEYVKILRLPDSLIQIDGQSLYEFTRLKEIKLSKDNKHFRFVDGALYSYNLKKLIRVMPNCKGIFEVPKGVKIIDHCAFYGCKHLTKIIIADSVKTIGRCAFEDCKSLIEIVLPKSLRALDTSTFQGCKSLSKIKLPNSIRKIGWLCFHDCDALKELCLPDSLSSIGPNAFPFKLQNFAIGSNNNHFSVVDGVLYNKDITELIAMPKNYVNKKLIIPDTVKKIRYEALWKCRKLKAIVLPDGLTDIGKAAFEGCSSLKSISIPNGIKTIPQNAFRSCEKLVKVRFPNKLRMIDDMAFYGCHHLQFVTLPATLRSIGSNVLPNNLVEINVSLRNPKQRDIFILNELSMNNEWEVTVNVPKGTKDKYEKYGSFNNWNIWEADMENIDYMKEPGMIHF